MKYNETIDFLFQKLPAFQKQGNAALKIDLKNIQAFCLALGHPEKKFKSIHVAGTNGKGSSSHMLASVLQEAGYKTGLYTSPHLKDFRERLKVNGQLADKEFVVNFVEKHRTFIEKLSPSFFEVTVAMAFEFFALKNVDVAVIEVGLGGRLPSTKVIEPILSLITNIGLDHTDILGDTLEKIAFEKAGIIKEKVPVVISEFQHETAEVFKNQAADKNAPIYFSKNLFKVEFQNEYEYKTNYLVSNLTEGNKWEQLCDLNGNYQEKNMQGILAAVKILNDKSLLQISNEATAKGIANIISNTKLSGRWQKIGDRPTIIADTGHNLEAFRYLARRLNSLNTTKLHLILAFSKDKYWKEMLSLLPKEAKYYFATYDSPRAEQTEPIYVFANDININSIGVYVNVNEALKEARREAKADDFIFIGGSTYFVAEINEL